ncbi:MAG TPA: molybdenum cofactor biosynthesis protein B [Candidatus Thermoplasmatota archaeon]|nr:molybdenum cofactor biosynthesis protein B [Candidatus Thermoplasmatota archaeon]
MAGRRAGRSRAVPGGPAHHRGAAQGAVLRLGAAVITVSSTRTRETDESGDLIQAAFEGAGHRVHFRAIVKDDARQIQAAVRRALKLREVDIIVTSGGTGMGRSDVTVEALTPLMEKRADGWGDTFRAVSREEIGNAAFLSRSVAGLASGKWIVAIPGSKGAARTAMANLLLPELPHMVWEARR